MPGVDGAPADSYFLGDQTWTIAFMEEPQWLHAARRDWIADSCNCLFERPSAVDALACIEVMVPYASSLQEAPLF
jgi:hypothetical protein